MDQIGNLLKQRRLELGLSLEEVSARTKLTHTHLKAIEEGNIYYFKDDLSYLAYYVRYYATELGLNYDAIRFDVESLINDYTMSIDASQVRKRIEINDNIKKKIGDQPQYRNPNLSKKKRRKLDLSFLAFIATAVLLFCLLVYLGINHAPSWFNQDPIDKPIVNKPEEKPDPDVEEPGDEPNDIVDENKMEIVAVDATNFEIVNWDETVPLVLEVKFLANQTWIAVRVNNLTISNPGSRIYSNGEEIRVSELGEANKEVLLHFGLMRGNEVYVNGEPLALDEQIANTNGVVKLNFKFAPPVED